MAWWLARRWSRSWNNSGKGRRRSKTFLVHAGCDRRIRMNSSRRTWAALPIKLPGIWKTQSGRLIDEQDFRVREESGAVAPALVLHDHAQDVWEGPDAGQATDATAGTRLGHDCDGSRVGSQAESVVAIHSTRESAHGRARRVSVLS